MGSIHQSERFKVVGGFLIVTGRRASKCCGAKTRRGTSCAAKALPNGRCKFHGGLSTGPRTTEGKARIAEAQVKRWVSHRKLAKGVQQSRQAKYQRQVEYNNSAITA